MANAGFVYLSGPIDFIDRGLAIGWRQEAANRLAYGGLASYNPVLPFTLPIERMVGDYGKAIGRIVNQVNEAALRRATALLVYVEEEQASIGTWREVERASDRGIPVHLVAPHLADCLSTVDLYHHPDLQSAVKAILRGPQPIEIVDTGTAFTSQLRVIEKSPEPSAAGQ